LTQEQPLAVAGDEESCQIVRSPHRHREEWTWNRDAERFGGFEVYYKLELGGLLDGKDWRRT
jgi:hypothetical protein